MGRLHPTYCEHKKCIDPGDESFGLEREDCFICGAGPFRNHPWELPPLDRWSIVGMNHYHVGGEKHLFCAMAKDGQLIKAEGNCAEKVFNSLKEQALQESD